MGYPWWYAATACPASWYRVPLMISSKLIGVTPFSSCLGIVDFECLSIALGRSSREQPPFGSMCFCLRYPTNPTKRRVIRIDMPFFVVGCMVGNQTVTRPLVLCNLTVGGCEVVRFVVGRWSSLNPRTRP